MTSIFLSHSSKDKLFARKIAADLAERGISVWVDEAELDIGDSLIERIAQGIYQCDFIAAVISFSSVESQWVQKELQLAMTREIEGKTIRVLPILIDACKDRLPFYLRDKLYADFTDESSYDAQFSRLLRGIFRRSQGKNERQQDPPRPVGEINIGSVLHDQGDDYLGFRLVRRKYRSGIQCFVVGVVTLLFCVLFFPYAPRRPLLLFLCCSGGIAIYGALTVLSSTYLRESYDLDRNLLLELERVGEAFIAFSGNWIRQWQIGKRNKKYLAAKCLEAAAHLSGLVAILFGVLTIVSLISDIRTM